MKPRVLVFSYVDWFIVFGIIISIVFLLIFPFQNGNNQAAIYMFQKKYDKAEQKWREVLNKNPLFPFYRMNLALNYMLWEQPEKAIREYGVMKNLVEKINYPNEEEILFTHCIIDAL
jgi:tetratricopeptide (TPR) repeat protein